MLIRMLALTCGLSCCAIITSMWAFVFVDEEHGMFDSNAPDPPICTCVNCGRENISCGGLWKGFSYASKNLRKKDVHVFFLTAKNLSIGYQIPQLMWI